MRLLAMEYVGRKVVLGRMAEAGAPGIVRTPYLVVDLTHPASGAEGVAWWTALTDRCGEGRVVEPESFAVRDAPRGSCSRR